MQGFRSTIISKPILLVVLCASVPLLGVRCHDAAQEAPGPAARPERPGGAEQPSAGEVARLKGMPMATPAFAQQGGRTLADIAAATVDSVVNISSTKVIEQPQNPLFNDPMLRRFFGFPEMPEQRRATSLGSGVVVNTDGTILTNYHVVAKADEIRVLFTDGRELDAKIVGSDPKSDLAVIKLTEEAPNLKPIAFGDSDRMRLGDVVLAIGNPFGLSHTVTMGIVSATGRANVGIAAYEDFIQTDAAINPGNSGGALVNMEGELIGINTAIVSRTGGYMGIGFAVPTNMARPIMESLIEYGEVRRGWLGVVIQEIDQELASAMNLSISKGVLISDVMEGSPAHEAGLKRGDVIVEFDERKIESVGELRNAVAANQPGSEVTVTILRDGQRKQIDVKLGELPEDMGEIKPAAPEGEGSFESSGLSVGPLDPMSRQRFSIPDGIEEGVVITAVRPGTFAAQAGLRPGDVILETNRKQIGSVEDFRKAYARADRKVLLLVWRQGNTFFVVLPKPRG